MPQESFLRSMMLTKFYRMNQKDECMTHVIKNQLIKTMMKSLNLQPRVKPRRRRKKPINDLVQHHMKIIRLFSMNMIVTSKKNMGMLKYYSIKK